MYEYGGVKIRWLGHDGFIIQNEKKVCIDPYEIETSEKVDILLLTHEHFDHCSVSDIKKVCDENTLIFAIPACKGELSKVKARQINYVKPNDKFKVGEINIEAVPAYNVNKFRAPNQPFHPKKDGKVGYILTIKGVRIYHMGDTDFIDEMKNLQVDIALVPVSGTYVMTSKEAIEATNMIKPKVAIPMHYGSIVGSEKDALDFKKEAKCEVVILKKEN
ncbi:MAG: MBL fold metallo-hydrolase [Nitrososphaerales archaeon]